MFRPGDTPGTRILAWQYRRQCESAKVFEELRKPRFQLLELVCKGSTCPAQLCSPSKPDVGMAIASGKQFPTRCIDTVGAASYEYP